MAKRKEKTQPLLKLRIEGPGVHSGAISVPDLVKICQTAQDAVNRQAEAMSGGQSLRPGPKSSLVYKECTLELAGIEKGSTVLPFNLAKPQQPLPLPESRTFGQQVVLEVVTALKRIASRRPHNNGFEQGLLASLAEMGDVLDKDVTKIEWIVPNVPGNHKRTVKAVFDKRVREKVLRRIKTPTTCKETVEGVLEMADFKEQDHKCRVHPPIGQPILCTFTHEQEQKVYDALRHPVRITGAATINPNNGRIESIAIESIGATEQLLMGAKGFYSGKSLQELADAQGVEPLTDPKVLVGGWPEGENVDEFLEDIYSSRNSRLT